MIPIFEYKDIFDKNSLKPSADPLINDLQETIENGLVNGEIIGLEFDDFGCEEEYVVREITEYNKFYIFSFLAKEYDYGFMTEEDKYIFDDFHFRLVNPDFIDVKKLD